MKLDVIDHCPGEWFLLREGENHYLDARCDVGAAGFSLLIRLSEAEYEEYRGLGRVFTTYLAAKISHSPHSYADRDLSSSLSDEVSDAVARFRSTG